MKMWAWLRKAFVAVSVPFGNCRGVTIQTLTPTEADAIVPELWDTAMNYLADRQAIGSRLSGPDGSEAAVIERTDLTKAPGDTIRFPMLGRLLATPRSNRQELEWPWLENFTEGNLEHLFCLEIRKWLKVRIMKLCKLQSITN